MARPQGVGEVEPVQTRHVEVRHEQIDGVEPTGLLERGRTVDRIDDVMPGLLERAPGELSDARIVVGQDDRCR